MTIPTPPTALIAEDEPLLAAALRAELTQVWPELRVVACVGDGASAVAQALLHLPDVVFLDIRMPGLSGLDAAAELVDAWPTDPRGGQPFPVLVFVTAYDQYAVQAFDAQALDYLLKPVQTPRLQKTVSKVQQALADRALIASQSIANTRATFTAPDPVLEATLAQLRDLLAAPRNAPHPSPQPGNPCGGASAPLDHIQASVGNSIRLVSVGEVVYFEAADKYVRVLTQTHEYLIRTPLKELLPQLPSRFWQVHRGTVVNADCIEAVTRDEAGKLSLQLRSRPERLAVSRLYAYLFKAM